MTGKRRLYVAVAAVLVAILGSATVLISQQPAPPAPPPTGAPGATAPPAAQPAPAAPTTAPGRGETLFPWISYQEFLKLHPEDAFAQIPPHYKKMELTETQWIQLARIFRGAKGVGAPRVQGRIGRELYVPAAKILAGIKAEMDIMKTIHDESIEEAWWFDASFPRIEVSAASPDMALISFDVIKHVKCGNFADRVLERLEPFSGPGEGRAEFTVITEDDGMYQRHQLLLSQEAVAYWPTLWSGDTMEARVFDVDGGEMLPGPLLRSAGHSGATILDMVYPPEIYYFGDTSSSFPRSRLHTTTGLYEYVPEYKFYRRSDGTPLKLDGVEGWFYTGWSFAIPLSRVPEIDRIEVTMVAGAPGAGGGGGGFGFGGGGGGGDEEDEEDEEED